MAPGSTQAHNPWHNIPRRILFLFLVAVFFTFSTLGIVNDIADLGRQPPLRFGLGIALSGLFAVCYAYFGVSRRGRFWKLFLLIFVMQVLLMGLISNILPDAPRLAANSPEVNRIQSRINFDAIAVTAAVFLGYAGFVYVFVSESRRHIRAHTEMAVYESELEAAQQVQQMIVPASGDIFPGFHVDSVYKPAQQVGGDFFQLLPDGAGGLLFVIGDVAGKGLPAAMLVSMLVGSVRTAAETTSAPLDILRVLQDRLIASTCGSFSTALTAHITGDGQVEIANAGHLSPYLDGKEISLPGALPLGIATSDKYQPLTFTLLPGSRLTFLTDGVVEAGSDAGALFGFDRAQAISTQPATAIAEAAVKFGQSDDITVVTIERLAS